MEIQLTKTKTITIGGGPKKRKPADIVGIDLFTDDARGCPAVRLIEKKGELRLAAVGFVPSPVDSLPTSWEAASKSCTWSLPSSFQASSAALAVTSKDMTYTQTTAESFRFDISAGVPVSQEGVRHVMKPMEAAEGFVMQATLPEYQVLWLSRLLPEGRRPTATSIQVRPAALSASILRQSAFKEDNGAALALFVSAHEIHVAGYKGGDIVLWRKCRGIAGWEGMRLALKKGLGLEDDMIASVLDDTLIDPRPVLDPIAAPIMNELAVSRDYLVGKLGVEPKRILALGLAAGERYWNAIAEDRLHLNLIAPNPFDGLVTSEKTFVGDGAATEGAGAAPFLGALGAALAAIGEEGAK